MQEHLTPGDGAAADGRHEYEPPRLEQHSDWEIVTGIPPSPQP